MLALLVGLAGLAWLGMAWFRGGFWRADQVLPAAVRTLRAWPSVAVLVPARNEAETLPQTLPSLGCQDYPGALAIWVIDDQSDDETASIIQSIAQTSRHPVYLLAGVPLPTGWTGKLWALEQGWQAIQSQGERYQYVLLTDADICHAPDGLRRLVSKAETEDLGLVSWMVKLRCVSWWDRLLLPAFVFFFQKLYPFPWVNDSKRPTAAAAGGCILLRSEILRRLGGFASLRNALIDDCTLAQRVKGLGFSLWLGLTDQTVSVRRYGSLASIWQMVTRTAFTQLQYSPWRLLGTVLGMSLVYLGPPVGSLWGGLTGQWLWAALALATWGLMAALYAPTLRWYNLPWHWGFTLPLAAALYTLMTLDSARRHWQGKGSAWKGRVYPKGSSGLGAAAD
ncbi:MAG: glycosyltransferase [Gloeomargarita sp. SKYBB_i_bin120]|nr:glycosyltransferase [Gloeomargarita sp. SKYG98]MCS7292482.1 glycosyltransferase [Gloeomargarita sp. SKYB120]MDW8178043.1 glycosyltransferase [Gloeomargarita sp. SKYBB_i_bin120]